MSDDIASGWTPAVTVNGAGNTRYDLPGSSIIGGGNDPGTPVKVAAGTSSTVTGTLPNTVITGGDNWNQLISVINYRLAKLVNLGFVLPTGIAAQTAIPANTIIDEQKHVLNYRSQIDYIRLSEGNPQFVWTDFPQVLPPTSTQASTYTYAQSTVKGYHLAEMRKALAGHYLTASITTDSFNVTFNTFTRNVFPQWNTLKPCVVADCFNYQGHYTASVSANNGVVSSSTSSINIYISDTDPTFLPYMTSACQALGDDTFGVNYTFACANGPGTYLGSGLPAWLSLSSGGVLSGIPPPGTVPSGGTFVQSINLSISNTVGSRTYKTQAALTIVFTNLSNPPANAPLILSSAGGATGIFPAFSYSVTAPGAISYSGSGFPTGITFNTGTGTTGGSVTNPEFGGDTNCVTKLSSGYGACGDWAVGSGHNFNATAPTSATAFQVERSTATFLVNNPVNRPPTNHLAGVTTLVVNPYTGFSPATLNIDFSLVSPNNGGQTIGVITCLQSFNSPYTPVPAGIEFWFGDLGTSGTQGQGSCQNTPVGLNPGTNNLWFDPVAFLPAHTGFGGGSMSLIYTTGGGENSLQTFSVGNIVSGHTYIVHMRIQDDTLTEDASAPYLYYTGDFTAPKQLVLLVNAIQIETHWTSTAGPG